MVKITRYADIKNYFEVPDAAIEFLAAITDETENGRYSFGDDCFINVMNATTRTELGNMEAHDVFVDVQCIFGGEERIYYTDRTPLEVVKPMNADKDVGLFAFVPCPYVDYKAGECVVLYPEEAHLPGRAVGEPVSMKKAVMKINCKRLGKDKKA